MTVSVWQSKPTEAMPWRVTARKGALVNTYRLRTEQEARDLAARIAEHN